MDVAKCGHDGQTTRLVETPQLRIRDARDDSQVRVHALVAITHFDAVDKPDHLPPVPGEGQEHLRITVIAAGTQKKVFPVRRRRIN